MMAKESSVTEHQERSGTGRRDYDKLKCPNCDVLWEHLAADRAASKEHLCGKISEVKTAVGTLAGKLEDQVKAHSQLVPRWMFLLAFGAVFSAGAWWFQSFGATVKEQQNYIKETVTTIHRRISETDNNRESLKDSMNELKWSVNALSTRISEVEKKPPK